MREFAPQLLASVGDRYISLTEKTPLTMILCALCVKANDPRLPIHTLSENLTACSSQSRVSKMAPPAFTESDRLSVGGETLDATDLGTLDGDAWLHDKVNN